jgi:cytochrome P450
MVVIAEARAADFIFRAPTTLVDRGAPRTFGPIGVRQELVPVEPLLTANRASHGRISAFVDDWLEQRKPEFEPTLERVMHEVMTEWVDIQRVPLLAALRDLVARTCVEWLLGVELRKNDVNAFLADVFEPLPSGLLASEVARAASRCPRRALKLASDLRRMAQGSPFRAELRELAERHGVEGPLDHMVFMALFNAAGGASGVLMPSLLEVARSPVLQELVEGSKPLGDFVLECHRLYGRPVLFSRIAQADFALPTTAGDFQIARGTQLTIATRICQTDSDIFVDPQRFDPDRYQRNPTERDFVFGSGAPSGASSGYRCPAADMGIQDKLIGSVLRTLFRKLEWRTSTDPVFDEIFDLYVGPRDLELIGLNWKERP